MMQPVSMTSIYPAADEKCTICLELFNGKSAIGHRVENLGNKVYCLVHESCLKTHMLYSKTIQCPTCKRTIDASTVFSVKDLTLKNKILFIDAWARLPVFTFFAAVAGIWCVKSAISSSDDTIYKLVSKVLLSGIVSSLPALIPNPICTKPKVVVLAAGVVSGFVGGASAVMFTSRATAALATSSLLTLSVAEYISTNLFFTEQLKNNPKGVLKSGVFYRPTSFD